MNRENIGKKLVLLSIVLLNICTPLLAKAEVTDNDLRKLFVISGIDPNQSATIEYGGIVLFKNYFENNVNACELKKKHPSLTIFIDQEGGAIVRIPNAAPPSPNTAQKMTNTAFYDAVKESAQKLKLACIDANLAPFVELSANDKNARSYGKTLEEVVPKATIFSKAMQAEGIKTVLKHFPGWQYDCIPVTDLSEINLKVKKGSEALRCKVMKNFEKVVESMSIFKKVPSDAWMVGNNIYEEFGPYPSSMNPAINEIIRKKMSYKGLLISDALWEIEASPKAILMALKVNDWVMVGFPMQVEAALPVIRASIEVGLITEVEIKEKLKRINEFKGK